MRLHRFIDNFELKFGNFKLYDKELFNQVRNVLKLKAGERIILCDGKMNEGIVEIKKYEKDHIKVEIQNISTNKNEPERSVILYCAILKRENFELVVQKATEIGVRKIIPIITDRTVKLNIRQDRLKKIIKEAAEQSGRGVVPILQEPVSFKEAIKDIADNGTNLLFDISGEKSNFHSIHYKLFITTWVGPEGGWTSQEIETAKTAGFEIVSLGNTILRAETAAIIGAYLIIYSAGL